MRTVPEYALSSTIFSVQIPGSKLFTPVKTVYNGKEWTVMEDIDYYDTRRDYLIQIPTGFTTDLASVPRPVWPLISPFDLSILAPLVHDWHYRGNDRDIYNRKESDVLFLDIMREEGVARWRRIPSYHVVRVVGGRHWK
jgi:hypothetical protein